MHDEEERPRRRLRVRWRRVGGVALAGLLVAAAIVRWDPFYEPPRVELIDIVQSSPAPDSLRLMTLNCAHGRATRFHQALTRESHIRSNLEAIARVIRAVDADVVALQELDAPSTWSGDFDHLAYLAELTGYPYSYHGLHVDRSSLPKVAYGTGVLSRHPLSNGASRAFAMNRLDTKGFVYVEVETPEIPIALVSVHLDFKRDSERRRQLAALTAFLKDKGHTQQLVVTGDFNTNVDARNGVLASFAQTNGLSSSIGRMPTFPARKPRKALDDFLLAQGLEATSKEAVDVLVSDHLPVVVDLRRAYVLSSPSLDRVATFDLGADLVLERSVPARLEQAYSLSRKVVQGYEDMGYSVTFTDEQPPETLRAEISDRNGTRIQADLALESEGPVSSLRVQLRGSVHVGGMQGMLASPAMVQKVARERLSSLLDLEFRDVHPEPEPTPGPADDTADDAADDTADDTADDPLQARLETLAVLLERRLITQDDYARKRREILDLL